MNVECVSLYGGHICEDTECPHEGDHHCECGATWTEEEADGSDE